VRIDVAFTPAEHVEAPIGVVVDVVRATSTIVQALASGWPRVLCCSEIDDARATRAALGEGLLGGERDASRIPGFDVGASPREFVTPNAQPLILSTTNGTRAILAAAEACDEVFIGSLLNLAALTDVLRRRGQDVAILCAGYKRAFAFDDAYCAGRIAAELDGEPTDAALAARMLAERFPDAEAGLNARTYGPPGLEADIAFCARESVLDVVPRFTGMVGVAAEVALEPTT
jgi:2-phosphosulfolactate phosphatase